MTATQAPTTLAHAAAAQAAHDYVVAALRGVSGRGAYAAMRALANQTPTSPGTIRDEAGQVIAAAAADALKLARTIAREHKAQGLAVPKAIQTAIDKGASNIAKIPGIKTLMTVRALLVRAAGLRLLPSELAANALEAACAAAEAEAAAAANTVASGEGEGTGEGEGEGEGTSAGEGEGEGEVATLQAENERLRAELIAVTQERDELKSEVIRLRLQMAGVTVGGKSQRKRNPAAVAVAA